MSESLTLYTAGTSLLLTDPANGIDLRSQEYPPPDRTVLFADSIDTEGGDPVARKYQNRQIPLTVRCFDTAAGGGQMDAKVKQLQQIVGRVQYEGGTLTRVAASGTINFKVVDTSLTVPADFFYATRKSADCSLAITAKPLGYGTELTLTDHVETTLPVLRFTEGTITGDVPALGRLVVDNDDTHDQVWMQWGLRSKNYGTAAGGSLFYEAETRLLQGGAVLAARAGASGGTVVRQGTLTTSYQSMLSLASSGTAYLSHAGRYNVRGRVYDPGGTSGVTSGGTMGNVKLALEWAAGDFVQVTRNDAISPPVINDYSIVDFGQVQIPVAVSGTQRWDGRIIGKGTDVNQSVDVDCVWFVPIDEGSGQATASLSTATPTTFTIRDEFNQAAGTITGKSLPVGGVYTAAGDADDFSLDTTNHWLTRTATADTTGANKNGHFAIAGATTFTNVLAQIDCETSAATGVTELGLALRYVDVNNFLAVLVQWQTLIKARVLVTKTVAGTESRLVPAPDIIFGDYIPSTVLAAPQVSIGAWATLRAAVQTDGRWYVWLAAQGGTFALVAYGSDSVLATGGALASGKVAILDYNPSGTATRNYDNFWVSTPVADAAAFGSQSLELRSDQIRREDTAGTVWGRPAKYEGNYLLVPPSGQEARTSEFIVKMSRNDPTTMSDPGIDDLSAQLFVTPRWLNVPES